MTKYCLFFLMSFGLITATSCSSSDETLITDEEENLGNEPQVEQIYLADPTIFQHDGTYYLYGTSQGKLTDKGEGFLVYTSDDLMRWEGPKGATDGFALKKGDAYGTTGFWAPQVFEYNDMFYMAYTANENIAIATSESPLGPFTNSGQAIDAPVKQIDPFIFIDDDGKKYLYHVRLEEGNRIFVAQLYDDLLSIKPETLTECISAKLHWENTRLVEWPVVEGPTVIKKDNLFYLIYSANDFRNPDYAVGYATSPSPMGPWEKSDVSPIIDKELVKQNGPGHGDIVIDQNGQMRYVLHTHFSQQSVHPRKAAVITLSFTEQQEGEKILTVDRETFRYLETKTN